MRAIQFSSQRGETVLELFGGSGSTLTGGEQTGRRGYLMEIDELYCDVIRRRWAEFVHGAGCDWATLTPTVDGSAVDVFTEVLVRSERGGPHSTGVAVRRDDGRHELAKAPLPAREFVGRGEFLDAVGQFDGRATAILGHTRWSSATAAGTAWWPRPDGLPKSLPCRVARGLALVRRGRARAR